MYLRHSDTPETYHVAQSAPPTSTSQVLRLQRCATIPSSLDVFHRSTRHRSLQTPEDWETNGAPSQDFPTGTLSCLWALGKTPMSAGIFLSFSCALRSLDDEPKD